MCTCINPTPTPTTTPAPASAPTPVPVSISSQAPTLIEQSIGFANSLDLSKISKSSGKGDGVIKVNKKKEASKENRMLVLMTSIKWDITKIIFRMRQES